MAAQEKEAYQRQMSMSRGGSRRGGDRGDHPQVGPDGWTVTGSSIQTRPSKAGDLSNFGKINKGQPMTFGPSCVFAGKKNEIRKESISRTAPSSNMFSIAKGMFYILVNLQKLTLQRMRLPGQKCMPALAGR